MQDPDVPPEEEGETDVGGAVVRQTTAATEAVTASSMGASIPLPWIIATAPL
jgi:hypothetical protein